MRIGVFICHCGTNIAGTVDVERVRDEIAKIENVVYSTNLKYSCSEPGQAAIKKAIQEYNLDCIVVCACSPKMHEPTFSRCIQDAGLNSYMLDMANIREHCSWVHTDKEAATEKAIRLAKSSVAKARHLVPLVSDRVSVEKQALVIGGGIAGIQAALDIANAGFKVAIVEREPSIGGRMAQLEKTFPTLDCSACILTPRMTESSKHPNIELITYSEVESVEGFVGNFTVTIRKKARYVDMSKCTGCGECYQRCPGKSESEFNLGLSKRKSIYVPFLQAVPNVPVIDKESCLYFKKGKCKVCEKFCPTGAIDYEQQDEVIKRRVGAIVVATGFDMIDVSAYSELSPDDPDVITSLQFERMCDTAGPTGGHIVKPSTGEPAKEVVFLQCVGSRDESKGVPYCSRICCMYTAKHALLLKEHEPDAQAYVFYMDVRAGGKNYEEFTRRVQKEYGAAFVRGRISKVAREGDKLIVWGVDSVANVQVKINADLVVLAPAIIPRDGAKKLAQLLNAPTDQYGFFMESHPKLQPVQSVTSGVFLAGACQGPKDIPDVVAQSGAAAAAALSILTKDYLLTEAKVAQVDEELCTGCFNCVEVCSYSAIEKVEVEDRLVARVNKSLCHGCGNCASACRSKVITVLGFTDDQVFSQIEAILEA